ncbi:hypothetical protein CDAR_404021 [Caerostris darwini]|uniref:Uncharacterized protein n=1 Tax=Caerostris darwini TaxID=1538125 RepID=A0AAV4STP0_9ARAC|nr:hypothetical protein CDAR_404021 [Caerostris darwini]
MEDLCRIDSDLVRDFYLHGDCINQRDLTKIFQRCSTDLRKDIMSLGKGIKGLDDFFKHTCPKSDDIMSCIYNGVKSDCGKDSEKLFRQIVNPFYQLFKQSCIETGNSASAASASVVLLTLQFVLLVFFFKKIHN